MSNSFSLNCTQIRAQKLDQSFIQLVKQKLSLEKILLKINYQLFRY